MSAPAGPGAGDATAPPERSTPSTEGIHIRWLAGSERSAAGEIWQALEARIDGGGLACSWDWTSVWLDHYGDVVPHRFAVGMAGDAACAVALVTSGVGRSRGPFKLRTVHLGTAGEPRGEGVFVEYNRVLVDPDQRAAFADALMRELREDPSWHQLELDGFTPEDAEAFLRAEPLLVARRADSPTMELHREEAEGGEILAAFKSSTRTKVRRSLKGLGGEVEGEWAETTEEALDILAELVDLHQRRWTDAGEPGAFASARFGEFHRAVVERMLPKGAVVLFRVSSGTATVGCLYGFVERGRLLLYQTGVASYEDRQIRPIFVACALCMQAASDRGLEEFDFLVGDSPHKRELSTTSRELVWATGRRPALRWRLLDALARIRDRLRGG